MPFVAAVYSDRAELIESPFLSFFCPTGRLYVVVLGQFSTFSHRCRGLDLIYMLDWQFLPSKQFLDPVFNNSSLGHASHSYKFRRLLPSLASAGSWSRQPSLNSEQPLSQSSNVPRHSLV